MCVCVCVCMCLCLHVCVSQHVTWQSKWVFQSYWSQGSWPDRRALPWRGQWWGWNRLCSQSLTSSVRQQTLKVDNVIKQSCPFGKVVHSSLFNTANPIFCLFLSAMFHCLHQQIHVTQLINETYQKAILSNDNVQDRNRSLKKTCCFSQDLQKEVACSFWSFITFLLLSGILMLVYTHGQE